MLRAIRTVLRRSPRWKRDEVAATCALRNLIGVGRTPCEDDCAVRSLPPPAHNSAFDGVADALDPVLAPLGFAAGQAGGAEGRGQVIFCRGDIGTSDGACVDLVDLEATPDSRHGRPYWGYRGDRWQLAFGATANSARS